MYTSIIVTLVTVATLVVIKQKREMDSRVIDLCEANKSARLVNITTHGCITGYFVHQTNNLRRQNYVAVLRDSFGNKRTTSISPNGQFSFGEVKIGQRVSILVFDISQGLYLQPRDGLWHSVNGDFTVSDFVEYGVADKVSFYDELKCFRVAIIIDSTQTDKPKQIDADLIDQEITEFFHQCVHISWIDKLDYMESHDLDLTFVQLKPSSFIEVGWWDELPALHEMAINSQLDNHKSFPDIANDGYVIMYPNENYKVWHKPGPARHYFKFSDYKHKRYQLSARFFKSCYEEFKDCIFVEFGTDVGSPHARQSLALNFVDQMIPIIIRANIEKTKKISLSLDIVPKITDQEIDKLASNNISLREQSVILEKMSRIPSLEGQRKFLEPLVEYYKNEFNDFYEFLRNKNVRVLTFSSDDYDKFRFEKNFFPRYDVHSIDTLGAFVLMRLHDELGKPGMFFIQVLDYPVNLFWQPYYKLLKLHQTEYISFGLHSDPLTAMFSLRQAEKTSLPGVIKIDLDFQAVMKDLSSVYAAKSGNFEPSIPKIKMNIEAADLMFAKITHAFSKLFDKTSIMSYHGSPFYKKDIRIFFENNPRMRDTAFSKLHQKFFFNSTRLNQHGFDVDLSMECGDLNNIYCLSDRMTIENILHNLSYVYDQTSCGAILNIHPANVLRRKFRYRRDFEAGDNSIKKLGEITGWSCVKTLLSVDRL